MSKLGEIIRDWANWVVAENDWDNPRDYLRKIGMTKNGWRPAALVVAELLQRARTEKQAAEIAQILEEFLPINTPPRVITMLRLRLEKRFRALGSVWGIERSILLRIATSATPEAKVVLKALNTKPKK